MTTETIKISELTPYERNARHHEPVDIDAIAKSIEAFGFRDPVGVWGPNNIIVEGHGRVMAAKQLGMTEVPCIRLDDLTDEQRRAYGLAHNKTAELSTWDAELLPLEVQDLPTYDMTEFGFSDTHKTATASAEAVDHDSLAERFIAPPFSVLDTRQGYWMERKKQWLALGIRSNDGRDKGLTYSISDKYDYMAKNYDTETSVFDPVLTELMYRWFCTMGGCIFDCFAGGSVRGVVAAVLGYNYTGIDLRQSQIDANYANAAEMNVSPVWYCDDSLNADKYVDDQTADMIFTCPPYADLEKYSDLENDISNMSYADFCRVYADILTIACRKLKTDRFFVIVVGDVRDRRGVYRQLVDYTRRVLTEAGLQLYNDLVLIEPVGTGAIRAPKQFNAARKVVKVHQNVLVFYKGDPKHIKGVYDAIDFSDEAQNIGA